MGAGGCIPSPGLIARSRLRASRQRTTLSPGLCSASSSTLTRRSPTPKESVRHWALDFE